MEQHCSSAKTVIGLWIHHQNCGWGPFPTRRAMTTEPLCHICDRPNYPRTTIWAISHICLSLFLVLFSLLFHWQDVLTLDISISPSVHPMPSGVCEIHCYCFQAPFCAVINIFLAWAHDWEWMREVPGFAMTGIFLCRWESCQLNTEADGKQNVTLRNKSAAIRQLKSTAVK